MADYIWTPAGTDITARWRRMGWIPPSELPSYQQKWSSYRELPSRKLNNSDITESINKYDNIISYPGTSK